MCLKVLQDRLNPCYGLATIQHQQSLQNLSKVLQIPATAAAICLQYRMLQAWAV
jgi:hypothetical protein